MTPTNAIAISETLTLRELGDRFGLHRTDDRAFFPEWYDRLPELSSADLQLCDRLRSRYRYYLESNLLLEESVKMMLLSPLMEAVGFYDSPFQTRFEDAVEIEVAGEDCIYRGRLDILVVCQQIWVLTIESKRVRFSVEAGIPQLLAYMLGDRASPTPLFGLATNGSTFIFLKLGKQDRLVYAKSNQFAIENDGDLERVLQVLYRIKAIAEP